MWLNKITHLLTYLLTTSGERNERVGKRGNVIHLSRPQSPCPVDHLRGSRGVFCGRDWGRMLWGLGHNVSRVVRAPGKIVMLSLQSNDDVLCFRYTTNLFSLQCTLALV